MYGKMKYVRFIDSNEMDCFIVFSTHMNHKETVKRIRHIEVVSAGFVTYLKDGTVVCEGRSESLRIDSQPEDSEMLQKQMRGF